MSKELAETILMKYGESLNEIGVNNWAVPLSISTSVLKELYQNKIAVLGGDLLKKTGGNQLNYVYANWYCEKLINENDLEFLNRSFLVAQQFIEAVVEKWEEELYIEFVV
ncbi:Imm40 family immunity protein [Phnomibacter sp. MR]|uniref:Imm40 family immunity protein n=1 Tax=Phnomibacter sp. MR TaxID=3042318 RepID=UPI003A7F898D